MNGPSDSHVLTLTCPDRTGIVAAVTGFLAERDGFLTELAHYADPYTKRSFLRTVFHAGSPKLPSREKLQQEFLSVAEKFSMDFRIVPAAQKCRVLVMVSRFGHCLNNLLHDWRAGTLPIDIRAVVSNHEDMRSLVEWHGIPYQHLPVTADTKLQQEERLRELVNSLEIDLVVLARYMQILSDDMCRALEWKAINIHHSFLPSFKGARPYHQAHARGVKIIGATAHYVTTALDEGPIIEQAVERIDHTQTPEDMIRIGRDIESVVLNRAVRWHAEHRILNNGNKTVVFKS
jgi:formyltetrahydrofolate deformylase